MKLKDYMSISGEHGLFKYIAQGRNAIIVEHLETGKRTSAHASAKVSSLEDISIFTETEDIPLAKVFDKIFEKENGGAAIDPKSEPQALRDYFSQVLPEYDKTRVYPSDIKKLLAWYNELQGKSLLVKEEAEEEKKPEEEVTANEAKPPSKSASEGKTKKAKPKTEAKKVKAAGKTESKSAATKAKGSPKVK